MEAASRRVPPAAPLAESTGRLPRARGVAAAAAEGHVGEASPECAEGASALPTAKSSANSGVAWPEWPGREGGRCEAMRRGGSDDSRAVRMLSAASAGASGVAAAADRHAAALSGSVLESLGASEPACGRCGVAGCVCMHVVLPSCGAAVGMQVISGKLLSVWVCMIETSCNKRSQHMHTMFELRRKPWHVREP